jgi:glucokinase
MMQDQLGVAVAVANDAHITALGEKAYGSAHGMKDFIVVSISHGGLGSCIFTNGLPHLGVNGFAGEVGHTCVEVNGRQCGCGRKGCLETYASAMGVARTAREFLKKDSGKSILHNLDPEKISSKDIYDAAVQGDSLAKVIFTYTGRILGRAMGDFVKFSSPQAIVLFGGLTKSREFFHDDMVKAMNDNLMQIWKGQIQILYSSLKESDAAILGASSMVWSPDEV